MSKKIITISSEIMDKIHDNHIQMRPRIYFIAGSIYVFLGMVFSMIGSVFLVSVTKFALKSHGPMGEYRWEQLLSSFPWWAPMLALMGLMIGISFLRKYDFSYKRNFVLIVIGFIASIIVAAFAIDSLGLNELWSRQGPMRRLYQQIETQNTVFPRGRGQGTMRSK
jgi:magnesium-transporting ATPase (P-type)